MNPLISIIIPVYNKEQYIQTCVKSVASQSYPNLEIILVNDGSTDSSAYLCTQIAQDTPNVLLINQNNQGVSAARNNGLKQARGQYVFFLDADDSLPLNALKSLLEKALECNADLTIGKMSENENLPVGFFEGEAFLQKALEDHPITYSACRILYKREFIQELRFPEGYAAHEDSFFIFLCALKMPIVATIDTVVYDYTVVDGSASRSRLTQKKYNDICQLLEKKETIIRENYEHLLPLFYHLKTKIQMSLLSYLCFTKGTEFRKQEKETLARFQKARRYYQPALPYANVSFYNILSRKMYYPYKIYMKMKQLK